MGLNSESDARSSNVRLRLVCIAVACASIVGACGGGDSDTPSQPTQGNVVVGDYVVYDNVATTIVPAGLPARLFTSTVAYYEVGNDLLRRVQTISDLIPPTYQTFNMAGALVSLDASVGGAAFCTYTPGLQSSPPYPRSVGLTWSVTSTRACDSFTSTQAGQIVARESLVTPAGTFDSFRTERQAISSSPSIGNSTQTLTCWYEAVRGILLRCDSTSSSTPVGGTTPNSVTTQTQVISALGGPGRITQGNALPRFAGSWAVNFTGGATGRCNQLVVNHAGVIAGTCNTDGVGSFTVNGTVAADGAVTIALQGGATLTGILATPYSGSGTWVQGAITGTWTARHI